MSPEENPYAGELDVRPMLGCLDIALLRKGVDWATAEAAKPDRMDCQWHQGRWKNTESARTCGTTYCVAGWIVTSVDGEDWPEDNIGTRAAELLGVPLDMLLQNRGTSGLFGGLNDIEDVVWEAQKLARLYGEEL